MGNLQELEAQKGVLLSDIRGKEQRLTQIKPKIQALKLVILFFYLNQKRLKLKLVLIYEHDFSAQLKMRSSQFA